MVMDVTPEGKVGQVLGWTGMANTAGFTIGPVIGGVLFQYGGWWAVFGTLLGMLAVDFGLRCTVIEQKRIIEEEEGEEEVFVAQSDAGSTMPLVTMPKKSKRKHGLIVLLRQSRMRFLLWGVVACGILISAFDAVSCSYSPEVVPANADHRRCPSSSETDLDGLHLAKD